MAHFPKAPRFPPEKPSDVPGPGVYNPKLHDPMDDPWRKGPLEIYKAPRLLPPDIRPDTFGLYNLDPPTENRTRTRAISTMATPSKHHNELLRLESKLFQYETQIESLQQSLAGSEATVKETRKALQRSDAEQRQTEVELEKLRKQIMALGGLQRKLVELEDEHQKSKTRRETEIGKLKHELRSAEDRALKDKVKFEAALEQAERKSGAGREEVREAFDRLNQHVAQRIPQLTTHLQIAEDTLRLEQKLKLMDGIRITKRLGDRVSQVNELAGLVGELEWREDEFTEVVDTLLEVEELARIELEEDNEVLMSEVERLELDFEQECQLSKIQSEILDVSKAELKMEIQVHQEYAKNIALQLDDARSTSTAVQSTLLESLKAYEDLSTTCKDIRTRLKDSEDQSAMKDCQIAQLTDQLTSVNANQVQLTDTLSNLRDQHSMAISEWETERCRLQAKADEATRTAQRETDARRKAGTELMVSRQAEAAARSELEHLEQVHVRVEALENEKAQLVKINDLLSRQSSLSAAEANKLASLNAELVSHQNPAQRLKVLDRIRREGREERTNVAHLQNELWSARAEIESLKEELLAYQSVSPTTAPIPAPKRKPSSGFVTPKSPSQQLVGLSRVSRPTLTEVTIHGSRSPPPTGKTAGFGAMEPPSSRSAISSLPLKIARGVGIRTTKKNTGPEPSKIGRSATVVEEPQAGEMSSGAIKMQGRMTLDELR